MQDQFFTLVDNSKPTKDLLDRAFQVRDRQLSEQAGLGAAAYPVVFILSVIPTEFYSRHPQLSAVFFCAFLFLSLARISVCHNFSRDYDHNPALWQNKFVVIMAGLGALWGIISAISLTYEPESTATLFFLFSGSGLAGGMISTVAIQKSAYRLYLMGILIPPGAAAFAQDTTLGPYLGAFHIVYFGFLWIQGKRLGRSFMRSTLNSFTIIEQRDELAKQKRKAESASMAKSRLLANVSHELRTPMNAIVGVTEWALDQGASAPTNGAWEEVHNASLQLLDVVNQVLDFAKIDSGQMSPPNNEDFSLDKSLKQVVQLFVRMAGNKGLKLRFIPPKQKGLFLTGDGGRFRQILCNLIGNATKFTEKGSITLSVDYQNDQLTARVTDTGPGIPESYQEKLFQPFSQADDSSTRRYGGTGLGLAISRDLAHSMGGELNLESTNEKGTTFILTLPLTRALERATLTTEMPVPLPPYEVLVVDDDSTNRGVAKRQLSQMGLQPYLAGNEEEALTLCQQQKFDLILMDLQMPECDGFVVTEHLKADTVGLNRETPVLAFTAHTGDEERERCLSLGMIGFLNKPLRKSTLQAELDRLAELSILKRS